MATEENTVIPFRKPKPITDRLQAETERLREAMAIIGTCRDATYDDSTFNLNCTLSVAYGRFATVLAQFEEITADCTRLEELEVRNRLEVTNG